MVPFLLNEVCKLRGTDCLHCIYILFCTVLNAEKRDCQEYKKKPFYRKNIHIRQTLYLRSEFVCVFAPVFKRVFRGQKIGLRYFKIQGTNFNALKISFQFLARKKAFFPVRFSLVLCAFYSRPTLVFIQNLRKPRVCLLPRKK